MAGTRLEKRQGSAFDGTSPYSNDGYNSWWYSDKGMAIRYSVVAVLFLLIGGYFLGGYMHARRRLKKGLQPLPYHRWMVRKQMYYSAAHPYARQWPQQQQQQPRTAPQYNGYYGGDAQAQPPPAYNADHAPPPKYAAGPEGGKIVADQTFGGPTHRAGEGSSTNAFPAVPVPPSQAARYL